MLYYCGTQSFIFCRTSRNSIPPHMQRKVRSRLKWNCATETETILWSFSPWPGRPHYWLIFLLQALFTTIQPVWLLVFFSAWCSGNGCIFYIELEWESEFPLESVCSDIGKWICLIRMSVREKADISFSLRITGELDKWLTSDNLAHHNNGVADRISIVSQESWFYRLRATMFCCERKN